MVDRHFSHVRIAEGESQYEILQKHNSMTETKPASNKSVHMHR